MSLPERARILAQAFVVTVIDTVAGMRFIPASYWLAMIVVLWVGLIVATVVT